MIYFIIILNSNSNDHLLNNYSVHSTMHIIQCPINLVFHQEDLK